MARLINEIVIDRLPSAQLTFDARDTQYNLPIGTDLISRQAAIDALEDAEDAFGYLTKDWREVLEQLPPIQPEIIRCKDCKHFAGEGMYCSCDIIVQFDHFYCYHAERRQDG